MTAARRHTVVISQEAPPWAQRLETDLNAILSAIGTQMAFQAAGIVVGSIQPYAGATAPSYWLLCYGQAISRADYSALFTALGTAYGVGDGSTTFNLPDLRGRAVAGKDDMGGTSANRLTGVTGGVDGDVLGGTGGAETHTLTTAQMPAHSHVVKSDVNAAAGGAIRALGAGTTFSTDANTGGGGAHNNVQPTLILNYIIYTGIA